MTQLTPIGLLSLPDEVIQSILSYLPPHQIPWVQRVCRRFANVASEQTLWRDFCVSSFRWWDKSHRLSARLQDPTATNWKDFYADRHRASRNTRSALDAMLDSETGRLEQIERILKSGYDVKGVLLEAFQSAKGSDKYLAQRLD
jgi:F-box protein 21